MAEIPLPLVEEELDSDDPAGSVVTLAMLVVGGGIVIMAFQYSQRIASGLTSVTDGVLGTTHDEDTGLGLM